MGVNKTFPIPSLKIGTHNFRNFLHEATNCTGNSIWLKLVKLCILYVNSMPGSDWQLPKDGSRYRYSFTDVDTCPVPLSVLLYNVKHHQKLL